MTEQTLSELPRLQEDLERLLVQLSKWEQAPEQELSRFTERLCVLYANPGFRHSYSRISRKLEKMMPDQRDSVCEKLERIRSSALDVMSALHISSETQKEVQKRIFKLCDHVELECVRLGRIDHVEYIRQEALCALSTAKNQLDQAEEKAEELRGRVGDYQAQSIAILGIFSGLVVTVSGVLQFTASGLQNLSDTAAWQIALFVSLAFFFLFNVVFLLLYCIARIAGTSLAAGCRHRSCDHCRSCKWLLQRMYIKYPYMLYFNLLAISVCIFLFFRCSG